MIDLTVVGDGPGPGDANDHLEPTERLRFVSRKTYAELEVEILRRR
jgi:hypothetical protein